MRYQMKKKFEYVDRKSFEGKTIKSIDATAVNVMRFEFTDGTSATLEVEGIGHGISGIVHCEYACGH